MGRLYIVATPIGNLDDISKRALDTLKSCDIIAAEDTRLSKKLLSHYGISKRLLSYHKFNEENSAAGIISLILDEDKDIALVSDAGTPLISDPGYTLVKEARSLGIEVIAIPGASAVICALSAAGIQTDEFTFYGFLPSKKSSMKKKLADILSPDSRTAVLYESPNRICSLVETIADLNSAADLVLFNDLTKLYERVYTGKPHEVLNDLKANDKHERGEYTLVLRTQKSKADESKSEDSICPEALIIQHMIREGLDLKAAISAAAKSSGIAKKTVYNAALSLKKLFED